jgi:hypothetical protein
MEDNNFIVPLAESGILSMSSVPREDSRCLADHQTASEGNKYLSLFPSASSERNYGELMVTSVARITQ